MSRASGVLAAMKAVPGGARYTPAPQSGGAGRISPVAANALYQNPYQNTYGPFLPRPSGTFTDGAFGPMSPIQPVPVDEPAIPGGFPDPRYWQYPVGWNLPTQPGAEGLKLASFAQLQTIASKYNVARRAIELRKEEIAGLEWEIQLTTKAAKAYQGDHKAMRDFGERAAMATKFFRHPDPDYFDFQSFLKALLEEIFVYDALCLVFRPKYGKGLGRGLLGSDLDSIRLVSGPCYSDDTEVLTKRGWLRFADTLPDDEFATREPKTKALEWQRPTYFHKEAWQGDLLNFHGQTLDILVTPNHRMLVNSRSRGTTAVAEPHGDEWIIPAQNLADGGTITQLIPLVSENGLPDLLSFKVPSSRLAYDEYVSFDSAEFRAARKRLGLTQTQLSVAAGCSYGTANKVEQGGTVRLRLAERLRDILSVPFIAVRDRLPFTEMTGDDFAAFMGMWLAEGCVSWHGETGKRRPTIYVTQARDGRGWMPYRDLLTRLLGREPAYNGHSFYFRHTGLAEYLRQFGHAHEKFLPPEALRLSARQAAVLWHYYWLGDGYADRQRICTSSPRMADDLQTLAQRMGKWATIRVEHKTGDSTLPDGRTLKAGKARPKYVVALQSIAAGQWHVKPVAYDSFVYCVSLPNETMYVRRNGKPAWCCNTIRPLLDMHGGKPRPPAPAYQQFIFGVPRSDFQTVISGADIDDYGLAGAEINQFRADTMLYLPLVPRRESPYGFPPIEQALLPIISGLQKQEFQLSYFTEGTVPAVYISPGDPNMTPTQIRELQDALNGIAGDPAYHLKVIVLPPGSKTEPQRPVDLSDSFDYLVMNQVLMQLDVMPTELGIIPDIGANATGPSASGIRFGAQSARDPKSRKSTKPLLMTLCGIANYVLQDICGQPDMEFSFEGLQDDEDKAAITTLGVEQVQNGIASIDEVRDRLDMPPWGLQETSEPVVFTAQGPIPFSMAPQLIASMQGQQAGGQGTNSGQKTPSSRSRTSQPSVRRGGQTAPSGSHPAPLAPHREAATPGHAAAAGAVQGPSGRTGGTASRSPVAGSRKRGEGHTDLSRKAVASELDALRRHLRKGRLISTWVAEHIPERALGMIAEDVAKGVLLDVAVERAGDICLKISSDEGAAPAGAVAAFPVAAEVTKAAHWPGWERDLGLVGAYKNLIGQAFHDAEARGSSLRRKAATGGMFVSNGVLRDLISDEVREVFSEVLTPLWTEAWHLGYASAKSLVTGQPADFTAKDGGEHLAGFIGTEGEHWLDQIARTGLGNNSARSELIARTEAGRAINSAALQCYRDNGVQYKHLLLSPGACDICKDTAEDGDIPLDAPFSGGGVLGLSHPADRCVPAPSWIDVEPPLADLGKSFLTVEQARQAAREHAGEEDESRVAWLLIRARGDDGKWRYLLQQRDDGTWGMPGGTCHVGEGGWDAAVRESTEEIGDLPDLTLRANLNHVDPDGKQVYLYLCEAPWVFTPPMNGSTPEETAGTGWFKRKEAGKLDLTPKFRDDWDHIIADTLDGFVPMIAVKSLQRMVNENGEVLTLTPASQALQAVGSRWPYPHRSDGAEWPDAGPGSVPDPHGSAGGEPPHRAGVFAEPDPHADIAPRGSDDGKMPSRGRKPNPPAEVFPNQGNAHDEMWPQPQATLTPAPALSVGASTGVPPSGASKNDSGHPVVGVVPAQTPQPYKPHSVEPEAFDPAEAVEDWNPEGDTDVVHDVGKGASDLRDPNPVEAAHVESQLLANYPAASIAWVKRGVHWAGPVLIPLDRIDTQDEESWAASHQLGAVRGFAKGIKDGTGHTNPVVMVQPPDGKAVVIDGHHRYLAYRLLGRPVKAYVGYVDKVTSEMLETHSSQIHSGSDPRNN